MARTIMLEELTQVLDYVPDTSPHSRYVEAIKVDNCLGKRSGKTRSLTLMLI